MPTWILPENIADVLPSEARKIEDARRRLLDLFRGYGYELVMPPMLEYLESLLAGAGEDTRLNTFKLTDQLSGRVLGVRSDTTIQVARIDAHLLNRQTVTRLCYAGAVLHARPTGLHANREPYQIGAEIYGHQGLEADAEILQLAMASLALAGFVQVRLDLCHAGIMRAVVRSDERAVRDEAALCELLRIKDVTGLKALSDNYLPATRAALLALTTLYGDIAILDEAERVLPLLPAISAGLQTLRSLASTVAGHQVSIDLADLRGYHYETGVTFSAYVPGLPNAIARGGRYDHVGEAFGRQRPATGFSMDLRELARLLPSAERKRAIRAPWTDDKAALALIAQQRLQGQVVIQTMPGHEQDQDEFDCDQVIVSEQGQWIITKVN